LPKFFYAYTKGGKLRSNQLRDRTHVKKSYNKTCVEFPKQYFDIYCSLLTSYGTY